MIKKLTALAALVLLLLTQRPQAQGPAGPANIYFVDIGTGASTLLVSPTGKTLLVDGGPDGSATKIAALMSTLGITTIDYTVVTHYHIDHISGITELINAGKVHGTAFDNGDGADVQPPGTSTSPASTRGHYLNYRAAITAHPEVTRATVAPGSTIEFGDGMRATFIAAGGRLLSGGQAAITNDDLNSESISVLVEFNNFDYLVSGDLTGGGSTSTAKTPDIETYVGQMVGDVDVVQLNHHGSTTTSNQTFLSAVKAEVAVAQTGEANTFGHPNRETVNKYLNTPDSNGHTFGETGVPASGTGPVFYQNEASPAGDDRVTRQGYTGTGAGNAGQGTIRLSTDGTTTYSLISFDDGGVRLPAAAHTYIVDGASAGVTTDFKPTVIAQTTPVVPLASDSVLVAAAVNDRESPISGVVLNYSLNGVAQSPATMTLAGGSFQATIPAQPDGTRVDYAITASAGSQTTTYASGYFAGVSPVSALRTLNTRGEPLYAGYAARIQGTVTAADFSGTGTNDDYVQDATGGINVYRSTQTPTQFAALTPGQTVETFGRINFLGGRLRLDLTESLEKVTSPYGVTVLSSGPAPTPVTTTIAALSTNPESFEGQFVSIANATIVSGTIPATAPFDAFVTISDGTGSFSLKIDHDTDVAGFTPASPFTVAGIIQQDDFLRPFDSGYDIAPRSRVDLGAAAPTPPALLTIGDARIDEVSNSDGTAGADFVPDRLNQVVRVRGVVSSIDFRGGNGIEYYVQDATGGIDLFSTTLNATFAIGDTVEATGSVTQFNGLTELIVSAVSVVTAGGAAPAPQIVTVSQLADGGVGEALEGRLVTINNVHVTPSSLPFPASGLSGNVTITDGTGFVLLRVDSDTNIDGTPTPTGNFSLTGLVGQFDSSAPFDSGYQVFPRFLDDIVSAPPTVTATPSSVDFGAVTVGTATLRTVTITNVNPFGITLATPFAIGGADAAQFAAGAPGTTTLAGGASTTVSVTFTPATAGTKSATLTINSDGGAAVVGLSGSGQGGTTTAAPIVISELRFRGPNGASDEFVELYNNSDTAADITGYTLRGSNNAGTNSVRATAPAAVIPARGHYLFVNQAAPAALVALADRTYATGVTADGGVAIATASGTLVDQVGLSSGSAYKEGTPLASLTVDANQSYERKPGGASGSTIDTNDNSADFILRSPSDPQNLASAPTPLLTVSPRALGFGTIATGTLATATVTITNPSATDVTLTPPFSITGADGSSFSVGTPGTTSLASGASTSVAVTFQPDSGGAKNATLTITSTNGGSPIVTLSGTGSGGITTNTSAINFGTVAVGALVSAPIVITNEDPSVVTLTAPFAITGTDASDFSVGLPSATTLAPGATASVAASFQPASAGGKTATLTITSANGGSRAIALSGSAACQAITIAGTLPGGTIGVPYSETLTASGGVAPYTFSIATGTLPTGLTLAPGGLVAGTPTAGGTFNFTVRATAANSCAGTASYSLPIAQPTLSAAPTSVNFGSVAIGNAATATLTLTNNSAVSIELAVPLTITGADTDQFAAGTPATTTLGPGTSTTATLSFLPTSAGSKTATLDIVSTGQGSASVALTGLGRAPGATTPIVISEFRARGPNGGNDEFVEIYNTTSAPIDISGYQLRASNAAGTMSTRATVAGGTILPSRGHFLFTNSAAGGYSGSVPGNQTYTVGITDDGGVAIATPVPATTIVDQVGLSAGSAFKEGTPLTSLGTSNLNRGYERKPGRLNGSAIDSDNNADDFQLASPSDPQNLASTLTPALSLSPSIVTFPDVALGSSRTVPITITNDGSQTVSLTPPFTVVGSGAAAFSIGAPAATTLAPGASTTADATFEPHATGSFVATAAIASDNGGNVQAVLSGAGVCPVITVAGSLAAAEFGVVYAGQLTASGAAGPYTFAITTGALPAGLLLDPATGAVSGTPTVLGVFTFTVTVILTNGCSGSADFSVTVGDTTAPLISVPASVTAEATGPLTPLTFVATATDLVDGSVPATCTPSSGAGFPVGTTTVNCTATDAHHNTATTMFTVTVTDHTGPALTLPGNLSATATAPAGAIVNYTATAADLVDGSRPVLCAPASGSTFAIGSTTVNCTASDTRGNASNGSFTVTINTADEPGRMTGNAEIESGAVTHSFDFFVQERASGADAGALRYTVKTKKKKGRDDEARFDSTAITSVTFFNVPGVSPGRRPPSGIDTVSFAGRGRWNGQSGFTFEAVAVDAGEPGRGHDRFSITIRSASGQIVASVNAIITQGNIQSLRILR